MRLPNLGKQAPSSMHDSNFTVPPSAGSDQDKPMYTGRYLVVFKSQLRSMTTSKRLFDKKLGLKVAAAGDFTSQQVSEELIRDADAFVFDKLGIALIDADEAQRVQIASDDDVLIVEPELIAYADISTPVAVSATWGLQACDVIKSGYSGRGVRIAVLDTGIDLHHPDFASRSIVHNSFVPGEPVQDGHGHGTHCIGTACGYVDPSGTRYGIAYNSEIYVGKVLSNGGSGAQSWIIDGMTWAADSSCNVISMSLGSRVFPGMGFNAPYERAAQYCVSKGSIVVAAAGNDSKRSIGAIIPVASPANCPSILAVGAVDEAMDIADFSNRGINPGQSVDIAGPGVGVHSASLMPQRYKTMAGTSMATPHIAGILALLCEQNPGWSSSQIVGQMNSLARNIGHGPVDVGAGLAIAP